MRIFKSILCASAAAAAIAAGVAQAAKARNPIIWADVPDVSVMRVGNEYYMSSTTMHMNPGVPVMKSKNLVDWEMAGYAYGTLGKGAQMDLEDGQNMYGGGSWASSLRHHGGLFWLSTFSHNTGKTYVFSAKSPEGPWKESAFSPALHDSSLFFDDDGRVYMTSGGGNIRLLELEKDASGPKPGGVDKIIIENASAVASPKVGLPAEGGQLFKVGGKYYLFLITWPPNDMRTEIVFRADNIEGPYEGRVVMRDRGIAQGGIVDTPDGKWYAMLFRDSGAVGRIPYLVPLKWVDGWPVLGSEGRVPDTLDIGAAQPAVPRIVMADEFSRRPGDGRLPMQWQWNHNPDNGAWSLSARPGFLRIITTRIDRDLTQAKNLLTQRTFGPVCSGETAIDTSKMKDGDTAGLALFQKKYGFAGVKAEGGKKRIVMVDAASGEPAERESVPLGSDRVYLRAEADYRNAADTANFFYSLDGKNWKHIGPSLKMEYTLPHFMGYRFALFNYASKSAGGSADFDYFRPGAELLSEK